MRTIKQILMSLLFLLFSFTALQAADKTVILANGEWVPYMSKNLKHYGVVSRIVSEAFALVGVSVDYRFRPWKRGFEEAKSGKWHGTPGWQHHPDREKYFYFSDPIMQSVTAFFHKKDSSFDWDTLLDLKGYQIGATVGYNYLQQFQIAEKSKIISVQRGSSDEGNFKKLMKGRVDVVVNELEVGYEILNKNHAKKRDSVVHHPKFLNQVDSYLILSKAVKGNDKMIELFNKGLKMLKERGKYDQYFEESRRGEYKK